MTTETVIAYILVSIIDENLWGKFKNDSVNVMGIPSNGIEMWIESESDHCEDQGKLYKQAIKMPKCQ